MKAQKDITEKIFQLLVPGCADASGEYFHDDCVVSLPFAPEGIPNEIVGKSNVIETFKVLDNYFNIMHMNIHEMYSCPAKNTIIVEATSICKTKPSNSTYQNRYIFLVTFEEEKIIKWTEHYNPITPLNL